MDQSALSKSADNIKLGGVAEDCASIRRDLVRLEKGADRIFMKFDQGKCKNPVPGEE